MVSLDQPIKKRRRYDVSPTEFDSQTDASPTVDGQFKDAKQAVVPSEDEKARKRRNREEIGNLYSSYRRVKYYLSQKDFRLMPDLEQAYLSMLKCSNGVLLPCVAGHLFQFVVTIMIATVDFNHVANVFIKGGCAMRLLKTSTSRPNQH